MSKLYSCDYDNKDTNYMVKYRRNMNFEEVDTKRSTG